MKDLVQHFNIYIYINNLLAVSYLRSYLQRAGYPKVTPCLNENRFQSLLKATPPHILFVDYEILHKKDPRAFLSFLFKASPETHIVALASPPFYSESVKNLDHGLNDVLPFSVFKENEQKMKEEEKGKKETQKEREEEEEPTQLDLKGLDRMILSKIDQHCQQYTLQKEQQKYAKQLQKQNLQIAHSVAPQGSLWAFKQKLEKAPTQHQLLQVFLEHPYLEETTVPTKGDSTDTDPTSPEEGATLQKEGTPHSSPLLFFHFLPSVYSFVLSHLFPTQKGKDSPLEGEAFSLSSNEIRNLMKKMHQGKLTLPSLEKFLATHFPGKNFALKFLTLHQGQLEGLFVQLEQTSMPFTKDLFFLFRDQYELLHLRKKILDLKVEDELTHLYTQDSFLKKVEEELSRARRIALPCSLVLFSIDQKELITQELPQAYTDFILKCMGKIIKTSSRLNDLLFRLGPVDFALLLPHTPQEGAALRAERLRCQLMHGILARQVQSLSLSFGVSEFPSCCHSGDVLIKMARLALKEAQKEEDPKVCVAKASKDFQPEFKPVS